MDRKNLKLNGTSEDDIKVISAHLQDSITQVKNIAHLKKNKIFSSNLIDLCGRILKREFLGKTKG